MNPDTDPTRSSEVVCALIEAHGRLNIDESLNRVRTILDKEAGSRINTMESMAAVLRSQNESDCIAAIHVTFCILMFFV